MSYDLIEVSQEDGETIELYQFTFGLGAANKIAYCDSDFPVVYLTDEYLPTFIEREAVQASESLDGSELEITVAEDSAVSDLFREQPPADIVGLTIFSCHWDESTSSVTTPVAIWVGRVLGCGRRGPEAVLRCEPAVTSLRRVGLRRHYQYMCPHVLYGPECKADPVPHTTATTVSAFSARTVTVSGTFGTEHRGGIVEWQPLNQSVERRTILLTNDNGDGTTTLTVAGGIRNLDVGDDIDVVRGCLHILDDCRDTFANAPNYGGDPYIPSNNPHGTTSIYN